MQKTTKIGINDNTIIKSCKARVFIKIPILELLLN